jgi:hypothetical protein
MTEASLSLPPDGSNTALVYWFSRSIILSLKASGTIGTSNLLPEFTSTVHDAQSFQL